MSQSFEDDLEEVSPAALARAREAVTSAHWRLASAEASLDKLNSEGSIHIPCVYPPDGYPIRQAEWFVKRAKEAKRFSAAAFAVRPGWHTDPDFRGKYVSSTVHPPPSTLLLLSLLVLCFPSHSFHTNSAPLPPCSLGRLCLWLMERPWPGTAG